MMKKIFIAGSIFILAFLSCWTSKEAPLEEEDALIGPPWKVEMSFNNCDSLVAFLKHVVVNSRVDTSLWSGELRIPFIKTSDESVESLFPEACFVGMSRKAFEDLFGVGGLDGKYLVDTYSLKMEKGGLKRLEIAVSFTEDGRVRQFSASLYVRRISAH